MNFIEPQYDYRVNLRWSDITVNDQVALYWQGTLADGTVGTQQVAGSHLVTEKDVMAGKVELTLSTETFLAPYEGGSVTTFYTLNRADGRRSMTQSQTTVYWLGPLPPVSEDFEGNREQIITSGQSVRLVNSGAELTNTATDGGLSLYLDGKAPPCSEWSLS